MWRSTALKTPTSGAVPWARSARIPRSTTSSTARTAGRLRDHLADRGPGAAIEPTAPSQPKSRRSKYPAKGGGASTIDRDEGPLKLDAEKIPKLKPAFKPDGTITAASASYNADGAAALVHDASRSIAERKGLPILAILRGHATHSQEPAWFTTAPIGAIRKVLAKTGWDAKDVELFEINEAFAVVVMAAMRDLGLDHDRVNIYGGACALGHPIGATGARIIVTLLNALMARRGAKRAASPAFASAAARRPRSRSNARALMNASDEIGRSPFGTSDFEDLGAFAHGAGGARGYRIRYVQAGLDDLGGSRSAGTRADLVWSWAARSALYEEDRFIRS